MGDQGLFMVHARRDCLPPTIVRIRWNCCRVDDEVMIVDGHSRAVAAWERGLAEVGVVFDEVGPLQHEARRWCRVAGVMTVADLAQRVVDQKNS